MRYRDTSKSSNTIATSVRKILNNYVMHDAKVLYDTSERVTASYFRKIFEKFYTFVSRRKRYKLQVQRNKKNQPNKKNTT